MPLPMATGHVDVTMPCGLVFQLNRWGVATRTRPDPHLPGWNQVLFPGDDDAYSNGDVIDRWREQATPCDWCGSGREPVLSTAPATHEGGLWDDQTLLLCDQHTARLVAQDHYPNRWSKPVEGAHHGS